MIKKGVFYCVVWVMLSQCYGFDALPRIKTRPASPYAEFYNSVTGENFQAIGASYVKLHEIGGNKFHANFIPGIYDPAEADAVLKKMSESGYTVVRVWVYRGHSTLRGAGLYSVEGTYSASTAALHQPYIDNLLDFLERATNYKIYVSVAIDSTPDNSYYGNMVNSGYAQIEGFIHREYLVAGAITAKEIFINELFQGIINRNPALLSTVFAYEIRNELHSTTDNAPFSLTSGWVLTGDGEEYNMGAAASRQACQNNNVKYFINRCVSAIKAKDPNALTTVSVFSFLPVGKEGLAGTGLLPTNMPDKRWPILPSVLAQSNLDFVDMHEYLPHEWQRSIASSNISQVDRTLKPFLCSEFGAHRINYSDVYEAAEALYNHRENIFDSGFQGAYLFTWDTYNHTRWTAMEDGGIVNERLMPNLWHKWHFNIDGFSQFWYAGSGVAGLNVSAGELAFTINAAGAAIYSPFIRLDAQKFKYLRIRLKNQTQGAIAKVYWTTKTDGNWNEAKSAGFATTAASDDYKLYYVDLSDNPNWSGIVNQLRFEPVDYSISSGSYVIDWIEIQPDGAGELVCGDYGYLDGDFNYDCIVDALDFAALAENWLIKY